MAKAVWMVALGEGDFYQFFTKPLSEFYVFYACRYAYLID